MKSIHIFRAGRHTSASGQELTFSEDDLAASVAAYDPAVHEAPIVIGHPKENGPAFGWIKALNLNEGGLHAEPHQVNADFDEMVRAGSFKKVSASFYAPDAPANPKPGSYYLRHVGFLGAQPPAIKGLAGVEFSASDEGVIEFSADWEVAGVFRRLREFLIEKFGVDDADKAIPSYLVEIAEDAARMPKPDTEPTPAYSEPTHGDKTMTEAELAAAKAQLEEDQRALESMRAEFAEDQKRAAQAAEATRIAGIRERVDALVQAGTITDAEKAAVSAFAESLAADASVEFQEGDDTVKRTQVDQFFALIGTRKPAVDFGEHSGGDDDPAPLAAAGGAKDLADKALAYREARAKEGVVISVTEAVNHIQKQAAA